MATTVPDGKNDGQTRGFPATVAIICKDNDFDGGGIWGALRLVGVGGGFMVGGNSIGESMVLVFVYGGGVCYFGGFLCLMRMGFEMFVLTNLKYVSKKKWSMDVRKMYGYSVRSQTLIIFDGSIGNVIHMQYTQIRLFLKKIIILKIKIEIFVFKNCILP